MKTMHKSTLPPTLHPATMGAKSVSPAATTGESKLLIFVGTEKTTPFSPTVNESMARAKTMFTQWNVLVEKIRNLAQTNPAFRGERLVASAVNALSNRMHFSVAVRDAATACFDNVPPLTDYMNEMASSHQAIAGYHDVMLRQTMIYAVKPLKDYVSLHYPRILNAYNDLVKKRDSYDIARNKKALNTQILQQQLLEQASVLEALLHSIPEQQLQAVKAVDTFVRAEYQ